MSWRLSQWASTLTRPPGQLPTANRQPKMTDPTKNPNWQSWPKAEKLVQLAAYHCDELKVREEPKGSNRGPWVDIYLRAAGVDPGNPWCAAFVTYLLQRVGQEQFPKHPAAVIEWSRWAEKSGHLVTEPKRGDLFFLLNSNGTGHIGIVLENKGTRIRTIEGNSNDDGSREGYAVVRHERPIRGLRFIRL